MNKLFLAILLFASISCNCQNFFWSHTGGKVPCEEGYGLLYNWYATTDARKISSSDDWIVPTSTDYNTLVSYLGGTSVAGHKLREIDSDYWSIIVNNTNESAFNARGGGNRKRITGAFDSMKSQGFYGATDSPGGAYCNMLQLPDNGSALVTGGVGTEGHKISGLSIRLLYTGAGTPTSYTGNDNKVYRVVAIGTSPVQYWLADNLQETRFRNGDIIPFHGVDNDSTFTNAEWAALTTAGVCAYGNDLSNVGCNFEFPEPEIVDVNYGYLYNWYVTQGTGTSSITSSDDWVVPSKANFDTLFSYIGGIETNGGKLKETGLTYWDDPNTGATNELGFNARGGGGRFGGEYYDLKYIGYLWTNEIDESDISDPKRPFDFRLYWDSSDDGWEIQTRDIGLSIRLIYTGEVTPTEYVGNDLKRYRIIQIGTQFWLADSLCETKLRNGTAIPEVTDGTTWAGLTTGARCSYDNDESNAINP